jgi:hypothetical protein
MGTDADTVAAHRCELHRCAATDVKWDILESLSEIDYVRVTYRYPKGKTLSSARDLDWKPRGPRLQSTTVPRRFAIFKGTDLAQSVHRIAPSAWPRGCNTCNFRIRKESKLQGTPWSVSLEAADAH